ncbi:MAG: hypothetical protein CVV24_13175 [Ignavibacteriae bacterium HGW-Ignavibacteriae-3]|nr:MAG: hypothetical protein CVV24_13175 [Ignavibacteriae bacterium HGW-Ignavibacteriae-3]
MAVPASLFAAILPMLAYLFLIWWMDRYEREPLQFVFLHFMWGAFGAVIFGVTGSYLLSYLAGISGTGSGTGEIIRTVILAPVSEEIAKGIFLVFTINSRKFDNITDGLVYGGAIGLGFGMTENFIYFLAYGNSLSSWIQIVLIRSLFSAVMHCIATASVGVFLAIAKFSLLKRRKYLPFFGFMIAILIHFIWNSAVSFEETFLYGLIFMILLIYYFFSIFKFAIRNEKRIIETELSEESASGLIPEPHIKILSTHLRFRSGWIDESIRKLYTRFAIRLAFRKNQIKYINDSSCEYYAAEIEINRAAILSLLSNNQKAE